MTTRARLVLAALAALAAPPAQAQYCFELIGPNQAVVSRSTVSPVDLSLPIGQALQARGLGDHHLLYYPDDGDCRPLPAEALTARAAAGLAPQAAPPAARLQAILDGIEVRHGPSAYLGFMRDEQPDWRWGNASTLGGRYLSQRGQGSQEVHTGPRGGRYIINSRGNKQYLDKDDPRR